jgi:GMP synthase (glutamine-hydrolysing)
VKPFLLLAVRADDAAADNEYASFLTLAGLKEGELRRVRLEQRPLGDVDVRDWSGIFVGGGPFNFTDPEELKSPVQRRVEADLHRLLDTVVSTDFPFLGACYGIGALGRHQGAVLDRRFAEPVGTVQVTLTAEADDIMARAVRSNVTWPPVILRQFVQRYAHRGSSGAADPAGSGPGLPSPQATHR